MKGTLAFLVMAAALEIGGDAAFRRGLVRPAGLWMLVGVLLLAAYGLVVNTNREIAFGRLMGIYIAVFFVVSQLLSAAFFSERPSPTLLIGGVLIVAGGLIIQLGRS